MFGPATPLKASAQGYFFLQQMLLYISLEIKLRLSLSGKQTLGLKLYPVSLTSSKCPGTFIAILQGPCASPITGGKIQKSISQEQVRTNNR